METYSMHLPGGIPTLRDVEALQQTDLYRQHVRFNRDFLDRHAAAMARYGRHWGLDPFSLWSRRWEYPFAAQRLIDFASNHPDQPLRVLDAGSGVTYFPYFIIEQLPQTRFICCDYDPSYARQFADINRDRGQLNVEFLQADLRKLPIDSRSLDAVCCISVLEHTDSYGQIIREFSRVLRPGGLFVLTFDLSLDGKFTLPRKAAAELLKVLAEHFLMPGGFDAQRELDRMHDSGILSTDHVRRTEPHLLPWTLPVRVYKAVQDLLQGRGWTGGFRSRTIFCIDVLNKGD
ncbi:MAG TPA: methyltransferase domain-containing protein [Tepidisphaeraceae bacterium]|nr:methyltransferase domain-containing protein [Tepidisphaeraceae bacterium]